MTIQRNIRIAFSGFPGPFNPTQIRALLAQRFDVVVDPERPDYVIYSAFSDEFLQYTDAIRIFFTGENVRPDFNLCDYAFGYDWLQFGDRYLRCPNYQLYSQFKGLCKQRRTDLTTIPSDRRFCNFIYTNGAGHPFRDKFFHLLSAYRRVDAAGAHLRNSNDVIGAAYKGDWATPKVQYQRGFKFSLAFENSSTPGYTTEKIVHAMAAGTIPIYWGNPEVSREFNSRRFINCHEFTSPEAIVARVAEIDRNEALYREILAEPFFPDDKVPAELQDAAILDRFEYIFDQPKEEAVRRNLYCWGLRYENRRRDAAAASAFINGNGLLPLLARGLRRVWSGPSIKSMKIAIEPKIASTTRLSTHSPAAPQLH